MVQRPVHRRTVAEPDIAARRILREEGEIVSRRRWRKACPHLLIKDRTSRTKRPRRRIRIVDDRRNSPLECIVHGNAVHGRRAMRQASDLGLELIAHLRRIGPRRPANLDDIRNDVQRLWFARLQETGADDRRLQRIDHPSDNRLQR